MCVYIYIYIYIYIFFSPHGVRARRRGGAPLARPSEGTVGVDRGLRKTATSLLHNSLSLSIYIYIYRERERERERDLCVHWAGSRGRPADRQVGRWVKVGLAWRDRQDSGMARRTPACAGLGRAGWVPRPTVGRAGRMVGLRGDSAACSRAQGDTAWLAHWAGRLPGLAEWPASLQASCAMGSWPAG